MAHTMRRPKDKQYNQMRRELAVNVWNVAKQLDSKRARRHSKLIVLKALREEG